MPEKTIIYKGFEISWESPPFFTGRWEANLCPTDKAHASILTREMGNITASEITEDAMLAQARQKVEEIRQRYGI
jgi:hypothetical protein